MTFQDKAKEILDDADKPLGNTIQQFETLLDQLTAAHQEAVIEELESIIKQFGISSSIPDHTVGMSIILNRIGTLKKGQK